MHPVDTLRSLVAKLEDVRVLLPHPAMGDYRCMVVVATDQLLIEATVEDPSGFGEGLLYLLRGDVAPPFSLRRGNDLTLPEKANARRCKPPTQFGPFLS
jgi:hypothetical protein